jgi:hypothetical protein
VGSSNFFSKIASMDPIAQALNLPGAHKYAQQQAQDEAGRAGASAGPYRGVTPTLAAANAGYTAGGPGATEGWQQYVPHDPSNFFQKQANVAGNLSIHPNSSGNPLGFSSPSVNNTANPYVTAAMGATTVNPNQKLWG